MNWWRQKKCSRIYRSEWSDFTCIPNIRSTFQIIYKDNKTIHCCMHKYIHCWTIYGNWMERNKWSLFLWRNLLYTVCPHLFKYLLILSVGSVSVSVGAFTGCTRNECLLDTLNVHCVHCAVTQVKVKRLPSTESKENG